MGTVSTGWQKFICVNYAIWWFRAIAHFVKGSQYYHHQVRKELMNYLLQNENERWAAIFGTPEEVRQYVELHQKQNEFGHGKELILAARLYQLNFMLYMPEEMPKYIYFSADYEMVSLWKKSWAK
jgi:hypothetical protein